MKASPVVVRCVVCTNEITRVRLHVERAIAVVERATPSLALIAERRARRRRLVAELRHYADAGAFPANDFSPERALPAFIDSSGTRCAMAHLVERFGAAPLVARVARDANHGFVRDVAVDWDLRQWLDAWGLSIDEAARIQPSYCWTAAHCACKNTPSAVTVLEVENDRVVKVHGKQGPEKVGDTLGTNPYKKSGSETYLVVPYEVSRGESKERAYEWKQVEAGRVTCATLDDGVKKEHAIKAILAKDCTKTLEAIDPKYTKECQPFRGRKKKTAADLGTFGASFVITALGAAIWVRRRREPGDAG